MTTSGLEDQETVKMENNTAAIIAKKKGVIIESDDEHVESEKTSSQKPEQILENMFSEDEEKVKPNDKENGHAKSETMSPGKLPSFKKAPAPPPTESADVVAAALPPDDDDFPMPSYRKRKSTSPHTNDKSAETIQGGSAEGGRYSRESSAALSSSHKREGDDPHKRSSGRRRSISPGRRREQDYYDDYYDSRSARRGGYEDDYYYDRYDYPPYDRYRSRGPPPPPRGGYDRYDRYERYPPPPPPRSRPKRYEVIKGSEEDRETTTCLYIGNLPYDFREPEVTEMFQKHGVLKSVNVPLDRHTGKNKGFAFVMFEQRTDASNAKEEFDGYQVDGRKLRIDWDIGRERKDVVKSSTRPPPRRSRGGPPPPPPAGYYDDYGRGGHERYEYEAGYHDEYRDDYPPEYREGAYDYHHSDYYPPQSAEEYYQHDRADPYYDSRRAGAEPITGSAPHYPEGSAIHDPYYGAVGGARADVPGNAGSQGVYSGHPQAPDSIGMNSMNPSTSAR